MVASAVAAIAMSFFLGSNDAANSLATAVGSGAMSLRRAIVLGAVMEATGAIALGGNVSGTIERFSGTDLPHCWKCDATSGGSNDDSGMMAMYIVAMLSSLVGATVFLFGATTLAMPVSTTHAVVGAVAAATVVGEGWSCLRWGLSGGVGGIVLSWVTSPLIAGLAASAVYTATRGTIAAPSNALLSRLACSHETLACVTYPAISFLQALGVSSMVLHNSSALKALPLWMLLLLTLSIALACGLVGIALNGHISRAAAGEASGVAAEEEELELLHERSSEEQASAPSAPQADVVQYEKQSCTHFRNNMRSFGGLNGSRRQCVASPSTNNNGSAKLHPAMRMQFTYLLVFISAMKALSHGSNDIANAAGGFSAVWGTYKGTCGATETPLWILASCAAFVALGIITQGYRVIETIGSRLTPLDIHQSWCIELATTIAVLLATVLGLPISTTHCQVCCHRSHIR